MKSFKLKNLKILVCIVFFLFLLGIVWHFFGSYKKEGFATGRVKYFNLEKGFGFITPEGGGTDLFVHISGVRGNGIKETDTVTFDINNSHKGLTATNVTGGSGWDGGSAPAPSVIAPTPLIIQTLPVRTIVPAAAAAAKPAAKKPTAKKNKNN